MTDYNVEGKLITKDDWEKWLKMKEKCSDRQLSNMPEPSARKEGKYAVIEWHKYPQEKPKKDDEYLVSVNMWNKVSLLLLLGLLQIVFSKIFGTNVYMPGQRSQGHIRSKKIIWRVRNERIILQAKR